MKGWSVWRRGVVAVASIGATLAVASCSAPRHTVARSTPPAAPAAVAPAAPAWPYCPRHEPAGEPSDAVASGISFRPCPGMARFTGVLDEHCDDEGRGDVSSFQCAPTLEVFDKMDVLVASTGLQSITISQNEVEGRMNSVDLDLDTVELTDGIEVLTVTRTDSDHMNTLSSTDVTYYAVGDDGTLAAILEVRIAETVMDEKTGDRVEQRSSVSIGKAPEGGVPDIVVESDVPSAERVRYRFNGKVYEVQGAPKG